MSLTFDLKQPYGNVQCGILNHSSFCSVCHIHQWCIGRALRQYYHCHLQEDYSDHVGYDI